MKKVAIGRSTPIRDERDQLGNYELYAEYLRGFDDVPVLRDAVRVPPPKALPDFRAGARRDERKETRPDPYVERELGKAELERLYDEYLHPVPVRPKAKKRAGKRKKKKR